MDKIKIKNEVEKIKDGIPRSGTTRGLIRLAIELESVLTQYFPRSPLKDTALLQLSQIQGIYNKELNGLLTNSEETTSKNSWLNRFLGLINEVFEEIESSTAFPATDKSTDMTATGPTNRPLRLFLSYAHADEALKNQLDIHLTGLKRGNLIDVWQDQALIPGQDWDQTIKQQLKQADIILLLISASFIASDYIWREELAHAISQREAGKSIVIPISLKPCDWSGMPFARFQALPRDAKPISTYDNIDLALMEVAKGIRSVVTYVVEQNEG